MSEVNKKIIPLEVRDEYILGSGVVIGAQGSFNSVYLRIKFDDKWTGLSIHATWMDALGAVGHQQILTSLDLVDCETDTCTYDIPVPQFATNHAGTVKLALSGYTVGGEAGREIKSLTNTVSGAFRVLESGATRLDDGSIDSTFAEQFHGLLTKMRDDLEEWGEFLGDWLYEIEDNIEGTVDKGGIDWTLIDDATRVRSNKIPIRENIFLYTVGNVEICCDFYNGDALISDESIGWTNKITVDQFDVPGATHFVLIARYDTNEKIASTLHLTSCIKWGKLSEGIVGSIADLRRAISTAHSRIDAADARIDAADARIDAADSRIDAADARIDAADSRIDAAHSRIDAADARIDAADSRIDAAHSRIDTAHLRIDDANTRIDDANTRINNVAGYIDEQLDGVGAAIDAILAIQNKLIGGDE